MGAQYNDAEPRSSEDGLAARVTAARAGGTALLLDGATGTELERRGIRSGLPLWSTLGLLDAPETVRAIHQDYVQAGVDAVTANTFRTQRRVLANAGMGERAGELTARAVTLAREAAGKRRPEDGRPVLVLGSAPTLEDCYRPDLVPDDATLGREHAEHAENLMAAGVDAILVETMNSVREARAATRAAREAGAAVWTSFVSWEDAALLSGEPLAEAIAAVAELGVVGVGVNCLPPSGVSACLPVLRAGGLPFSVQANLGAPDDEIGFTRSEDCAPETFAATAGTWLEAGASAVGGCCGTTPAHISAIAGALQRG